jgi:hypothetical protein
VDDSPYEPSDDELALITRELIRVANRKGMTATEVSAFILSTVATYEDRLLQMLDDIHEGIGLDYTYGVWRVVVDSKRGRR